MTITNTAAIRTFAATILILLAHRVLAQEVSTDTTRRTFTGAIVDSLPTSIIPIPYVGSVTRSPAFLITDSTLNFFDYNYAGDFLKVIPGLFTYNIGSPGQLHGITIDGLDNRNIAFLSDGILLNEPLTGTFNPYLYPLESAERIEIIVGPRAFWHGLNGSAGAVNFVSKSKKAIHPSTRIRYSEEPYGHGFIDGSFSQDIIRGMNLSAGAFHHTYEGRFQNSSDDHWNGRMKARYNIGNKLDLFASGMYNQTHLGLNGGVDLTKTPGDLLFDRLQATLVNTDAYEKVTRFDLQLGAAAILFNDTTAMTTLSAFHSTNFREYRDEENRPDPNGRFVTQDDRSQWYGIKLTQHLTIQNNPVELGAEVQRRGVIASDVIGQQVRNLTSLFGKIELHPTGEITAAGYGKLDDYLDRSRFSIGADATLRLSDHLSLFIGYSDSYRFPTFRELHLPDTTFGFLGQTAGAEHHHLLHAGVAIAGRDAAANLKYIHGIADAYNLIVPLSYSQRSSTSSIVKDVDVLDADVTARVGSFFLDARGQHRFIERISPRSSNPALVEIRGPEWSAAGGIYFWDKLVDGHLDLKTGIQGRVFSSYAVEYDQQAQVFFSTTAADINASGILDVVLIAHIGDAYVHLIMENLLDRQYVITTFFPMPERHLRFGISWDFKD